MNNQSALKEINRMGDSSYSYTVATRCFTYNHAAYIKDTLNGFSIQKHDFPVVYIIVDDASTDGEPEVLFQWAKHNLVYKEESSLWRNMPYGKLAVSTLSNNPNALFAILLLNENHYQTGKSFKRFDYISEWYQSAKYHALCEGDDFWTDSLKLQKQVDFLEKNKDFVLVYTDSKVVNKSSRAILSNKPKHFEGNCLTPLVYYGNFIMTASICYRAETEIGLHSFRDAIPFPLMMGDYPDWVYLSTKGSFKYLDVEMVAYRLLAESASHSSDFNHVLSFAKNELDLKKYFNQLYNLNINNKRFEKSYYKNIIRAAAGYDKKLYLDKLTLGIKKYPSILFSIKIWAISFVKLILSKSL